MTLRLVTFDVGGVIYSDDAFARAAHEALADLGAPTAIEEFREVYDLARNTQGASIRATLAATVLKDAGRKKELAAAIDKCWRINDDDLYSDAMVAIESVRKLGCKVALVANQPAQIRRVLDRHGINAAVDYAAISGVLGVSKPDPAIFEAALSATNVPASLALHVGNRFETDVKPAKQLGMKTAWVLRGEAPDEPAAEQLAISDLVMTDLTQLVPAIEEAGLL